MAEAACWRRRTPQWRDHGFYLRAAIPLAITPHGPEATIAQESRQRSLFFFQAEDGIRDGHVPGVQTCALPIFHADEDPHRVLGGPQSAESDRAKRASEIGRASCRERGEISVVAVSLKKKH